MGVFRTSGYLPPSPKCDPASSFICKCDATVPFPEEYIDEVTDYLFTTEEWNMYELILIGNLYLFIDIPLLHRMGQRF